MKYKSYENRKIILTGIVLVVSILFIIRLFYVQLIDEKYVLSANNNVLRYMTQYPARGLVYDRNGELLIYNEAAYDLMVIPRLVRKIDTLEFCRLVGISKEDFIFKMDRARNFSTHKSSVFEPQIPKESYGYIEEKLYKYSGFYVQSRTLRKYPHSTAAHSLGYIGEVSPWEIEKNPYYKIGDYIGKSGIEKAYETELRGQKGLKIKMVDVFNREKGSYLEGRYDTSAISGNDLVMTVDLVLQEYGELLMKNKRGSIVAIEPATGEILALISSPSYDPNLLVGRIRNQNYPLLEADTLKPLFNRALLAQYPPGSTFKPTGTLIALQEGVINVNSRFPCGGVGAVPIKCSHNHYSPLSLLEAIEQSCNPYFWSVFKAVIDNPKFGSTQKAFEKWREYLLSFNLGRTFQSDLLVERSGNVPSSEYYDKYFGKNRWRSMTIRSLSIGQGEILVTPLQLANMAAIIANRGYYCDPHLVKTIKRNGVSEILKPEKRITMVDPRHYDIVVEGMRRVYAGDHGTGRWYADENLSMCGKTGTVQNPHGENHSLFMAFAPVDNPKIAIAVVVENGGFGATFAAPIATLMMKKYIQRDFEKPPYEARIIEANLLYR
ncbi:MAG: penicillin-binding protein 2 [Bacteroidales bacterium]|nr:penicillin-binding protein 2 [Bacteroidales bacterium]